LKYRFLFLSCFLDSLFLFFFLGFHRPPLLSVGFLAEFFFHWRVRIGDGSPLFKGRFEPTLCLLRVLISRTLLKHGHQPYFFRTPPGTFPPPLPRFKFCMDRKAREPLFHEETGSRLRPPSQFSIGIDGFPLVLIRFDHDPD